MYNLFLDTDLTQTGGCTASESFNVNVVVVVFFVVMVVVFFVVSGVIVFVVVAIGGVLGVDVIVIVVCVLVAVAVVVGIVIVVTALLKRIYGREKLIVA